MFLAPLCCSDVAVLPELSNYFGEYNVIESDRKDSQKNGNQAQVVIKQSYPLNESLIDYMK